MIYRIFSSLDSFKSLEFGPGLNVVITEKVADSGAGQTRNKAGKSSIVQLIHFVLGGEGGTGSLFRKPDLAAHSFGAELDVRGARIRVSRSGATFGRLEVDVLEGNLAEWPEDPLEGLSRGVVTQTKWREALGKAIFGIPETSGVYGPKFSMLLSYFARRAENGGLQDAKRQSGLQQPVDVRVALSFLIGIDWQISQRREVLRKDIEAANQLQKAARGGALQDVVGDPRQLLTQLALSQQEVERLSEAVKTFQVLEDYRDREREASELTRQLNVVADENAQDHFYSEELRRSIQTEEAPSLSDLRRVYNEAGISLPGLALERYDQVRRFHDSVIQNRRLYLQEELAEAEIRAAKRSRLMKQLNGRRAEVMALLRTHGALEHHTELQLQLSRAVARAEQIKEKQKLLASAAEQVAELKIEQQQLSLQLQRDFRENEYLLERAILSFERASESLYENPGNINIYVADAGPEFEVRIQGEKSRGVNGAQIFCFDMMLMDMALYRNISPRFLIHDSHLFDPVDGRQKDQAWAYGAVLAAELGFQYIITLNSDQIPEQGDRASGFRIEDYVVEPRLTDAPGGGLFGFEFG